MKKIVIIVICLLFFLAPADADAGTNAAVKISFFVNGAAVVFDAETGEPFISETGRVMMPVRTCLDAIGCSVDWNPQTKVVITQKGGLTVLIPVGEKEITVGGAQVKTDTAAVILKGKTYLPLRSVLEAYGYAVDWDQVSRSVYATELTAFNINGGTTGIFLRKQLPFEGFDGITAEITLPFVPELEKGDCPYVYFGFDWEGDKGNVEGGFQFIEDPAHPLYKKWVVFMRQGNEWRWGNNISAEQGETHRVNFYAEYTSQGHVDLVIELDGQEVIRKKSAAENFDRASVKTVISMAMTKKFDGFNCASKSIGAKISNVKVRTGSMGYVDFSAFPLYSRWQPETGANGMWYGTSKCVPAYIHIEADGKVSIYREQ